jgi:thiamine biosynthesis protein ThiS
MEITLNGVKRLYDGPATLPGLLKSLGVCPGTVVVEINFRIVPLESQEKETIREGDAIEVIRLVGGG